MGVLSKRFAEFKLVTLLEWCWNGIVFAIANRDVLFQVYIKNALVIWCHCCNHVTLFVTLALLVDELLLELQFVFKLLLFDSVFGIGDFAFHLELCRALRLYKEEYEQNNYSEQNYNSDDEVSFENTFWNGTHLFCGYVVTDKVCKHPVCRFDRHVVNGFLHAVVCKWCRTLLVGCEICANLVDGITVFKCGVFHGCEQVFIVGESAENHALKRFAVFCINVAGGCAVCV